MITFIYEIILSKINFNSNIGLDKPMFENIFVDKFIKIKYT